MTDNALLGWALIGCGGAGRGHAQMAAANLDIKVCGFCDTRAESALQAREQYPGSYHTTDPDRIFADPEVDIVSIATSHQSHAELALATCQAGKHLYLEKPMAMTVADCLRIAAAVRNAGTRLMINFSIRFSGAAQAIKQRLGPAKVSHGQCMMGPADLSRWRWHPEEGGGPLFDVGVHALDLICWIHDSDPVEVYATGGQITHPGELGSPDLIDTAAVTLRFANSSAATFLMSDAGFNDVVSKWFFEFCDGHNSAVLHEHFRAVTFGGSSDETLRPDPLERMPRLVEAIRTGTGPDISAREGIVSALLVEKIIQAVHSGQPQKITIPTEF